jgi:hypothetical protein
VTGLAGLILGAIAAVVYIYSHNIMVGCQRGVDAVKSWFTKTGGN